MKQQNKIFTDDVTRIKYEAERFFTGDTFDLYEDERLIATLEPSQCAVDINYGKPVLSCWGEGWSRSWRVVACEMAKDALQLHCTKQIGRVKCTLELLRGEAKKTTSKSRREYADKIAALIETNFAGIKIHRLVTAREDSRHLSGIQTRLLLTGAGNTIAAIAVSENESQPCIDATLSAGLIWLEELRARGADVKRLLIFVPVGCAFTIASRLLYLKLETTKISLYEVDEKRRLITPVTPFAQADLIDNLQRAARRAKWSQGQPRSVEVTNFIAELNHLVADGIDTEERSGWIYLSIRGLTFARISTKQMKTEFGLALPRKRLTEDNRRDFERLILAIDKNRTAEVNWQTDERFRAQAERWLEARIRKDVAVIDPTLDWRFVYSQVPVYRGEQRSFIDLLAATRTGRLVVMELKVSEDPEFPFQGLDYWMRIDWHRVRGDFERRGYFKGLRLLDMPPLLYLIAPLFRFHATTKLIASAISNPVPVYRIGINDNWRSGVRVLLSERLNA